jgi:hypothetical protein
MQTYDAANDYLGTKADRPLTGRATRIQRRPGGAIAIKYHETDVITYHPDGRIVARNGGYQTSTTKARINEYSPIRVWASKGMWYADFVGRDTAAPRVIFADGLTFHEDTLIGGIDPATVEPAKRRLDRAVRKYIDGFCAHVAEARELAPPSNGDCWGCLFSKVRPAGFVSNAEPDEPLGYSHYLSHFGGTEEQPEPYYVPSLVWKAVQRRGNPAFCYQRIQAEAKRGDTRMLRDDLRAHFRKLKPGLLKEYR